MPYVGKLEIRGEAIGRTYHEGHDGWTFHAIWEPGMGEDKLVEVLNRVRSEGMAARSQEIGRLLGVAQKE